jgi:hypothetical protein
MSWLTGALAQRYTESPDERDEREVRHTMQSWLTSVTDAKLCKMEFWLTGASKSV